MDARAARMTYRQDWWRLFENHHNRRRQTGCQDRAVSLAGAQCLLVVVELFSWRGLG